MPLRPLAAGSVPTFSPELEAEIAADLAERLGERPSDSDLADYRAVLYAVALTCDSILQREADERRAIQGIPSPDPPCPKPRSTPASRRSPTTAKS